MERTQQLHATHRATWMAGGFILLATVIFSEPVSASTVVVAPGQPVYLAPSATVYHGYGYRHYGYGGSVHGYHGGAYYHNGSAYRHGGVNRNGGVNRVGRR